jgi:uncharacterized repeat protein (TIGR01451 family)
VGQRSLYGTLLLTAGLLALAGQVPGQPPAPPPPDPPPASTPWGPTNAAAPPLAAPKTPAAPKSAAGIVTVPELASTHPVVIASSKPAGPPPVEPIAPVPDDGLPLRAPTPPKPPSTPPPPPPSDPGAGNIRSAGYPPEHDPGSAGPDRPGPVVPVGLKTSVPSAGPGASLLALEVTGPRNGAVGQPLTCTIVVRNLGDGVLAGVRVEAPLPAGAQVLLTEPSADNQEGRLRWRLGNLEAGGKRALKVELLPSAPGELRLRPTASFATALGLRAQVIRPVFALTLPAAATATVGARVVLPIQVTNNGAALITRVVLQAQLSPGLQHPQGNLIQADVGTLAPGQTRTVRLEAVASEVGRQVCEVLARADGGLEAHTRASVTVSRRTVTLRIDGPRQGTLGGELAFQLELTNPGSGQADNMRLTQVLPDGLEFVSASTGGTFDPSRHAVVWALGTLEPGQKQTVTLKVRGRLAGDWALPASAAGGGPGGQTEARATAAVHVEAVPTLTLELTARDETVPVGGESVYEVRVVNQGQTPASGLILIAALPTGLRAIQAEGPAHWHALGQQVSFEPLARLGPRADAVYRIRVRGDRPGAGTFRAQLSAAALPHPVLGERAARVVAVGQ